MKNYISILLIVLMCSGVFAQELPGIQFTHDNWAMTLQQAKEQNKIVFVDAYTTWCGPCKVMAAKVFTQPSVGEFYNTNFINAKIDMEKGEGLKLAKAYNVRAYPTFLYVNGDGELVHRGVGSQPADKFIELGRQAMDPTMQLLTQKRKYDKGDRSPAFLRNYATILRSSMAGNHSKVAGEYLKTQQDWSTPKNMKFIFEFADDPKSKGYAYMLENREKFYQEIGKDKIISKIKYVLNSSIRRNRDITLEEVEKMYRDVLPEEADRLTSEYKLNFYQYSTEEGAKDKFVDVAIHHMKNYPPKAWGPYNSLAWRFYELTDDKKMLKQAAKWAKKSVEIEANYYNTDTMAAICYKLGKKGPAMKYAQMAIDFGKKQGGDTSETEKLLKKIVKM